MVAQIASVAQVLSLAWEFPHATGVARKNYEGRLATGVVTRKSQVEKGTVCYTELSVPPPLIGLL